MLDAETKQRIDAARDILVGKIPNPQAQVEQITIALIYKFMDDMDRESVEMGGKASFFTGEYKKYAWTKMFDPKLGGQETFDLYVDAISKITKNPNIPKLFRDIFKNAYLPYRDPETLKLFLKTINEFTYDHSEKLGDAFEYLLSVLGSQGDAGQFRTPRHIIDFIVSIIDPKKGETVLDPACGTAGFLISAYKHILANNMKKTPGDKLNPAEKKELLKNFSGYDISPDMVRLSLVNLYLHGFVQPQIYEYDTLTSEEKWKEYADVILANPPFMSPSGGIRPHKRFSIPSNRSEVLFVDYIAEHLKPNGRAGIIVPEGIIFQSGTAYKTLRKMLVEKYLVAVISLPAGVFNPYSGVKTSIIILDAAIAKEAKTVAFFKVENDGFSLGSQRRENEKNDLPLVVNELTEYLANLRSKKSANKIKPTLRLIVPKVKISENGEYNLSGDRYRVSDKRSSEYPHVKLGEVCEVISGQSPEGINYNEKAEGTPFYQGKTEFSDRYIGSPTMWTTQETKIAIKDDILMSVRAPVGPVNIATQRICIGRGLAAIRVSEKVLMPYVFTFLRTIEKEIKGNGGAVFDSINRKDIEAIKLPFPPIEIQKEIVSEIDGYQKVIDGACAVLENYRPQISTDSAWPRVELEEVCDIRSGGTPSRSEPSFWNGTIPWVGSTVCKDCEVTKAEEFITEEGLNNSSAKLFPAGTTLIALVGATIGKTGFLKFDSTTNQNISGLYPKSLEVLNPVYLFHATQMLYPEFLKLGGGKFRMANFSFVKEQKIPLPPLEIQEKIVAEIEAEQVLVASNRELIERFEKKIQDTIARVWKD